ncbi:HAD-like domain-containing protein [Chaetomidium leptoderma]|uniref:Enolase-phosphatase E1 n=1 Tax=Chaetomidium leptoderma TaxID=669021 RepID=A0AAN6ZWL4_9PEZI|nr:HAD-like domain-containing protein [Chaetomidium leptoderma]
MAAANKPRVVLLDIEGTVCPISFVKDVLFPYALTALPATLEREWCSPAFAPYRDAFPPEHAATPAALTSHVRDLMSRDVKVAYLKSLQGYLWEAGYASGALKAPLFADVAGRMASWATTATATATTTTKGEEDDDGSGCCCRVMIYSSGSVPAQKLLFGHTDADSTAAVGGDLRGLISDWFDTVNAGPKTERASYEKIAAQYPEVPVGEWLFLSDNVKEVVAAKEAGMQSVVVERPGNAALSEEDRRVHRVVTSFYEL